MHAWQNLYYIQIGGAFNNMDQQKGSDSDGTMVLDPMRGFGVDDVQVNQVIQNFRSLEKGQWINREQQMNEDRMQFGGSSDQENHYAGLGSTRTLRHLQKNLRDKLYKVNFALLQMQTLTKWFYLVIVLMEAFQIFWLLYYQVICRNGFANNSVFRLDVSGYISKLVSQLEMTAATNQTAFNTTLQQDRIHAMIKAAQTALILDTTFRMDDLTKWSNPALYVIETDFSGADAIEGVYGSNMWYITSYGLMCGVFYAMILIMLVGSSVFFKVSKRESYRESVKLVMRIVAIVQYLYISYLAVPFLTLLFQAFNCDEDPLLQYTQQGISCEGTHHKFLMIFSIVTLLVYLGFASIQLTLHQSSDINTHIPWSSFDRHTYSVKLLVKVILVCNFIFDKRAIDKPILIMVTFVMMLYVLFRRFKDSIIFNYQIHVVSTCADILNTYHLFFVGLHIIINSRQSVSTVYIFLLNSVVFMILYTVAQEYARLRMLEDDGYFEKASENQCEIYFFRVLQLAQSNTLADQMYMHGQMAIHMDDCKDAKCDCNQLIEKYDVVTKMVEQQINVQMMERSQTLVNRRQISDSEQITKELQQDPSNENLYASGSLVSQGFGETRNGLLLRSEREGMAIDEGAEISLSPLDHPKLSRNYQTPGQNIFEVESNEGNSPNGGNYQVIDQSKLNIFGLQKKNAKEAITRQRKTPQARQEGLTESPKMEEEQDQETIHVNDLYYVFAKIAVETTLRRFPRSSNLRLLLAFLYKQKLNNHFKSLYELSLCEKQGLTFAQTFTVFRRKQEIEAELQQQHLKQIQKSGDIDSTLLFNHERAYLNFLKNETLAANTAIKFWKELSLTNFNASKLRALGIEVSKNLQTVEECGKRVIEKSPNDMKFYFRFGMFLLKVSNNEFEALDCFKNLQKHYSLRSQLRLRDGMGNHVTKSFENSGGVVVVLSAQLNSLGRIIHVNDEIETFLGYKRQDILGLNVTCIMPSIIGQFHDGFIKRFLDSGTQKVFNVDRQTFAETKDHYIVPINLVVKIYPEVSGQIVLIGMLQKLSEFSDMQEAPQEYRGLDVNYMLSSHIGLISNVTRGLYYQLGLNSTFFNYSPDALLSQVSAEKICGELLDPANQDIFSHEGMVVPFNTRNMMQFVETEKLSHEEVQFIQSRIGECKVFVQLKKFVFNPHLKDQTVNLFRLIVIKGGNLLSTDSPQDKKVSQYRNSFTNLLGESEIRSAKQSSEDELGGVNQSISSQSSANGSLNAFNSMVRDFKKGLNVRTMPPSLTSINRVITVILLVTIIMGIVVLNELSNETSRLEIKNNKNYFSEKRRMIFVQTVIFIRSYLGVPNKLASKTYGLAQLNEIIARATYIRRLIVSQQDALQNIQNVLIQDRRPNGEDNDDILVKDFNYQDVNLLDVDNSNHIVGFKQPYIVAMNAFLGQMNLLNDTNLTPLWLEDDLIQSPPIADPNKTFLPTNLIQKQVFRLLTNGIRFLRWRTDESADYVKKVQLQGKMSTDALLIILLVSICVTFVSMIILFVMFIKVEKLQGDILSLYIYLKRSEIQKVQVTVIQYMREIVEGSFIAQITPNDFQKSSKAVKLQGTYNNEESGEKRLSKQKTTKTNLEEAKEEEKPFTRGGIVKKGKFKVINEDEQFSGEGMNNNDITGSGLLNKQTEGAALLFSEIKDIDIYVLMQRRANQEIKAIQEQPKIEKQRQFNAHQNDDDQEEESEEQSIKKEKVKTEFMEKRFRIKGKHHGKSKEAKQSKKAGQSQAQIAGPEEFFDQKRKNSKKKEELSESGSTSSRSSFDKKHKKLHQQRLTADQEQKRRSSVIELNEAQLFVLKKQQFNQTFSTKNTGRKFISAFIMLGIIAYFLQAYFMHLDFIDEMKYMQANLPVFIDRFRYMMLIYGLYRERVGGNNSLATFEWVDGYGYNADAYYNDMSMHNEKLIVELKTTHRDSIKEIVDFTMLIDSSSFCPEVIENSMDSLDLELSHANQISTVSGKIQDYQGLIQSIFLACNAAKRGDLALLKQIYQNGIIDLNLGNYDSLSPLYFAVRTNQIQIVKYLVEEAGVFINKVDRWGGTALDYAVVGSEVDLYLRSFNASKNLNATSALPVMSPTAMNMTIDQVRMFYAVQYNDLISVKKLDALGVSVNVKDFEDRTPLHLAASEGYMAIVKYLIARDGQLSAVDTRGNDPRKDALREKRTEVYDLLNSVKTNYIIKEQCFFFNNGLYKNGILTAFGNYHKKFEDMMALINSTNDFYRRMSIIRIDRYVNVIPKDFKSMQQLIFSEYFQSNELYFSRTIRMLTEKVQGVYDGFFNSYRAQTQVIFVVYISAMGVIFLVLRSRLIMRMRDDILESRGVLNLIPTNFFEENKATVENLMKKLKQ